MAVVLTLGSHTGKFRLLSSGCFSNTGFGHSLQEEANHSYVIKYEPCHHVDKSVKSSPFGENQEELMNECSSYSVGVKLAGPGHQHGPRHSTQKAQNVGINPSTCSHTAKLDKFKTYSVHKMKFGISRSPRASTKTQPKNNIWFILPWLKERRY